MKIGLYVAWLIAVVMLALAVVAPPSINFGSRTSSYFSARASRSHSHARGYHRQRNDFYTLLRWICCAAFAYSAFAAFQMKRFIWTWVFAILAVLFNPLAPFYLQRPTWQVIDCASIAVIVFAAIIFWRDKGMPVKLRK
jgi:hypothetical protein